jgi:rhodanese-related sulfurtransferase
MTDPNAQPLNVHPEQVKAELDGQADLTLLDCREDHEWQFNRIDGAVHIPMQQTPQRLDEIPRDTPVIVYCHAGVRSQNVANFLRQNGYNARSMSGGIDAWSQLIDPSVPRY